MAAEFFGAAFPWIALGLLVGIVCGVFRGRR